MLLRKYFGQQNFEKIEDWSHCTIYFQPVCSWVLIDIDDVVLLHFERLIVVDETAVEEETERVDGHADPLGVWFFNFPIWVVSFTRMWISLEFTGPPAHY